MLSVFCSGNSLPWRSGTSKFALFRGYSILPLGIQYLKLSLSFLPLKPLGFTVVKGIGFPSCLVRNLRKQFTERVDGHSLRLRKQFTESAMGWCRGWLLLTRINATFWGNLQGGKQAAFWMSPCYHAEKCTSLILSLWFQYVSYFLGASFPALLPLHQVRRHQTKATNCLISAGLSQTLKSFDR